MVKDLCQSHLVLCSSSSKRGLSHYDPVEYPYIATAIFKGKWTLGEHRNLLGDILDRYEVNPEVRGFV